MSREPAGFQLKWNDYESNIRDAFFNLKEEKDFSDVTLVCGDGQVEAHKVILSACSPFFQRILKQNSHTHPLIYLKGVKFTDLESILQFMYLGKVDVVTANLVTLLDVAQELEVKGLMKGAQCPPTTASRELGAPPNVLQPPANVLQPPANVLQATPDIRQPLPPSTRRLSCQAGRVLPIEEDFTGDDDKGSIRLKPWLKLAQPGLSLQTTAAEDHEQYGQYDQYGLHGLEVGEEEEDEEEEDEEEEDEEKDEENGANVSEAVDGNQNWKKAEERRNAFFQQYLVKVSGSEFKCNVAGCGKKMMRSDHAVDHIEGVHFIGKFLYRCSKCHQDLKSWRSFYNHGRCKHSVSFTKIDILQAMK